jgi:hypothetical protein
MATLDDAAAIALALPEVDEGERRGTGRSSWSTSSTATPAWRTR